MVYNLTQYLNHPEVEEKIKILTFFGKYGLEPTKDAFSVSRSIIFSCGRGRLKMEKVHFWA